MKQRDYKVMTSLYKSSTIIMPQSWLDFQPNALLKSIQTKSNLDNVSMFYVLFFLVKHGATLPTDSISMDETYCFVSDQVVQRVTWHMS